MVKYVADVTDTLSWQVEFEAPDGLTDEELKERALDAWSDGEEYAATSTLRYSDQEVTTVLKLEK